MSGAITHNQSSWIEATATGPNTLTFYWKVSSERSYDYLRFYIDGVEQSKISGNVNWQQKTYSFGSGSHTLKWEYTKDYSVSSGSDAGWLDKVDLQIPGVPVPDIKANGSDGPITVSSSTPVSVTVSLDPGGNAGQNADWWVYAYSPLGTYSYVYPSGWHPGLIRAIATPLFSLSSTEILHRTLPVGSYEITFAVDNNADGILDGTWSDSVEVTVVSSLYPPDLISPEEGDVLDNGCEDFSNPIEWDFDWSDVSIATKYHIYVIGPNATIPIIDHTVYASSYHSYRMGSYIANANRFNWAWKVRAGDDNGNWSEWSEERHFDVEPLNTDCP